MHVADPYKEVSPFLKRVLRQYGETYGFARLRCLDAPSGHGRNTFFLADCCLSVLAVDIDRKGLGVIITERLVNIETLYLDLLGPLPDLSGFGLVCMVHFYDSAFLSTLLTGLQPGTLVLIETPGCQGENFRKLPTRSEVEALLAGQEILINEFHACPHRMNRVGRGSLKAFLKIIK